MSILTQAEIPISDSMGLHELPDDDLSDKPLLSSDDNANSAADSSVKKILLNNRIYLKKQFIGILYRALHLLIYKPPSNKPVEFSSLNLAERKSVDLNA
jgi:hypothetical protein